MLSVTVGTRVAVYVLRLLIVTSSAFLASNPDFVPLEKEVCARSGTSILSMIGE